MATIRVTKNEATAARRRVYFHCVDATDGITPETGEAAGQPQISVDGGAWTNTGIGTLVAIGNGRYYAELTQAVTNADYAVISTRFKSANTAEALGDTVVVDKLIEDSAASRSLLENATYGLSAIEMLVDDLESRITATRAGYLDNLDAAISTRLATASYAAAPSAASNATAVRSELATELGRIDATVGSRLATAGYTAPANATIASIDGKVDALNDISTADVTLSLTAYDVAKATDIPGDYATATSVAAIPTTPLLAADYTAPTNLTAQQVWEYVTRELTSAGSGGATAQEVWEYATRALTDKTGFSGTATNMRGTDNALLAANYIAPPTTAAIATAVWGATTRTLSSFGTLVSSIWTNATRSLTDKVGYSGVATNAATPADLASIGASITELTKHAKNKMTKVDNGDGTMTVTIFDDDGTTPLLTYLYTSATDTRSKAV